MAEYIKRRDVSGACYEIYEETVRAGQNLTAEEVKQVILKFEEKIKSVPAADVAPVQHGRWVINSDGYYPQCSQCMDEPKGGVMTDYCPNCGARMDGGKGDE